MSARCCQMRTGVLFFGFFLGTSELTLWVIFYTFRAGLRAAAQYDARHEEDLIAASAIVTVDIAVNVLLICGANKDYSGRRKDLRRWGFMVPWAFVYAANILGLFTSSMVLFFWLPGGSKAFGLVPLVWCAGILFGYCIVVFFIMEQRADLDIYLTQQQNALARGNSDAAVS